MEDERIYENVLNLAVLFSNKKGIKSIFKEIVNVVKEHEEKRLERDIPLPCAFLDKERGFISINFNSLVKAIAKAYSDGDLMMEDDICNDLLVNIHLKKTIEEKIIESKKNRNRVYLTYSMMQHFLGLCYVASSKLHVEKLKGFVNIGRDYSTNMIYKVEGETTQYKMVPLSIDGWMERGIPASTMEELTDILKEIDAKQVAYGSPKCNAYWKNNDKLTKSHFE